jgi:hypothetical protein
MTKRGFLLLVAGLGTALPTPAHAGKPWENLIPFKRVEASADKEYALTEEQGPWLILASSFAGPGAERQARDLVFDLRKNFNLPAYVHKQTYDYTQRVEGLGFNRYGGPKVMRYANPAKFEEIAVMVGNFQSVDDPDLDKTLQKIWHARPACLDLQKNKATTQRFIGLRELQRRWTPDPEKKQRGPMANAFVARNPLLPKEMFAPEGLDPFVEQMNRDVQYSLLKNPKPYTVRVATFRGASTMKREEIEHQGRNLPNKLEQGALKAHELTVALRRQGEEAYEFHDRYESIVTIGGFDTVGAPRADGKIEINPEMHRIVKKYGGQQQKIPGQTLLGLTPTTLNGIAFDVQPLPVEVPRTSIATAYAPSNRLFR